MTHWRLSGARSLKLSRKTVAARRNLLRVVGPLISGFCVDGTATLRYVVTGSVVGSGPRKSLRFVRRLCHCKVFR